MRPGQGHCRTCNAATYDMDVPAALEHLRHRMECKRRGVKIGVWTEMDRRAVEILSEFSQRVYGFVKTKTGGAVAARIGSGSANAAPCESAGCANT